MRIATRRLADAKAAFPTEAALCQVFVDRARAQGFVVHAECSNWDLVLVAPDGLQVGVEAKLRPNLDVLAQAIGPQTRGPDVHAVLVPYVRYGCVFEVVASQLGILVIRAVQLFDPIGIDIAQLVSGARRWYHDAPLWMPPQEIVEMRAGHPSPVRITPWKVAAMELCKILRAKGFLVRSDFSTQRVSPTWWITGTAAPLCCERVGKQWRYVATGKPLPDERWPEVARALNGKV